MQDSFRQKLIETLPHLRAFAIGITKDKTRADDLVQDAVIRAMVAADQFNPGTNFKAWIFTILRNQYINDFRKSKIRQRHLESEMQREQIAPASQESSIALGELREALDELPVEFQEVVMLVAVNGFSYEEAAEVCGCAIGTVKSRLWRAREKLQHRLSGELAAAALGEEGRV